MAAAGLRLQVSNTAITSNRLVRNGPNLAGIIYSAPAIGISKILNFETQDGRRHPGAIEKNNSRGVC